MIHTTELITMHDFTYLTAAYDSTYDVKLLLDVATCLQSYLDNHIQKS